MRVSSWQQLVQEPGDNRHVVQTYREPAFLRDAVAAWTGWSLRRGGGAVLFGTPRNLGAVRAALREDGLDPDTLEGTGRLVVMDANDVLSRVMKDGRPDVVAFRRLVTGALGRTRAASAGDEVRAWGEMVDLLRKRGNPAAAKRMEEMWNDVIDKEDFRLLCSYEVDNLAPETHEGVLHEICAGHTRLIPEPDDARFETAVSRALVDVFGEAEARTIRHAFASRHALPVDMPAAEAVLVALHEIQPVLAKRVLAATRAHMTDTPP